MIVFRSILVPLKAALEEHFGKTLRLAITVTDKAGSAPAAIATPSAR